LFVYSCREGGYLFRTYKPAVFSELRSVFGVSEEEYAKSVLGDPLKMKKNFSEGDLALLSSFVSQIRLHGFQARVVRSSTSPWTKCT